MMAAALQITGWPNIHTVSGIKIYWYVTSNGSMSNIQGIHKRMVRYQKWIILKPHHSIVYALYIWVTHTTELTGKNYK
jgi:hypothetical protein